MHAAAGSSCVWGSATGAPRSAVVASNATHLRCTVPAVSDAGIVTLTLALNGSTGSGGGGDTPGVERDSGLEFELYGYACAA